MMFQICFKQIYLVTRPKPLKLVVVAFPLGAHNYGNSITTGPPVSRKWTGYVLFKNSPGNMDL